MAAKWLDIAMCSANEIGLPQEMKTCGMVLMDQIRSVDREQRLLRKIEAVPQSFIILVRFAAMSVAFSISWYPFRIFDAIPVTMTIKNWPRRLGQLY
ncbi:hypothetical protein AB4Z52_03770 [Rhizobium sp. 2YAF20]|uniref:hypothetical protein n=1 Tax=Rhizobium sp. 2YAF20 TaxID=3233027 RepID=UPI003F96888E